MGRKTKNIIIAFTWLVLTVLLGSINAALADEADVFLVNLQPNVLVLLGNNNGFDEDFMGNAICSWATGSRSVESRRQLLSLVNTNVNNMRIGLMTYSLPSVAAWNLHNNVYFTSYNIQSWCPTPPSEPGCVDYCINGTVSSRNACTSACQVGNPSFNVDYTMSDQYGKDAVILNYSPGTYPRTKYCPLIYPKLNRLQNPTDASNYVYYNLPGTLYAPSNMGNAFCYANTYIGDDAWSDDSYNCDSVKTGNNDNFNNYGGNNIYNGAFQPSDEDTALGFNDFGIRNAWTYSGPTWFANRSPGGGYLRVPCSTNASNNSQLNSLTAQLAMHENDPAGYMSCSNAGNPNACSYIINAGLTPTEGTFQSAINYFQGGTDYQSNVSYATPIQAWCQNNFVVLVTSGLQNTDPNGATNTAANLEQGVLNQIQALQNLTVPAFPGHTFNVNTYVLGMSLTEQSKPLLDAMAVAGGTADANGHAYYADNPTELATQLAAIPQDIISRTYSFTVTSVSSSRVSDENFLYQASFTPVNGNPFWHGYLQKYNLNADGSVGSSVWEAGSLLTVRDYSTRHIYTAQNGSLVPFTASLPMSLFGVSSATTETNIVGYIQGNPTYNPDGWKLGDIFHSTPVGVGTPNIFFEDTRDHSYASYACNGATILANAFDQFRCNNQRSSANGLRLIVAGANDGQFHVFRTLDGLEMWSFVPPNLLPQLQYLAHMSNPSTLLHQYLVDGPVTVADVWWKSAGGSSDGTTKVQSDWHTMAIFGEGDGGVNLWSSDPYCGQNQQATYDSAHKYYCGYYAFDLTNTASPPTSFNWLLGGTAGISSANGPYLGAPWSKMLVGRVAYNMGGQMYEKWVGFIGGGYNVSNCSGGGACGTCDCRGLGFYVVDLSNGQILWSYTYGNDTNMRYPMPAAPAIVDVDGDGLIDTVYLGDLGGNMWRFKFCRAADLPNCGISGQQVNWTGGRLYQSSVAQNIFQSATVAQDAQQNIWVYWGTGNHISPKQDTVTSDTIYGIMDDDRTTTYTRGNLQNISTVGQTFNTGGGQDGWYINFPGAGEKMLADPTVFGGFVYFTTYTPPTGSGDLCAQSGTSSLYAVGYTSGNGAFGGSARSTSLGSGMASAPIISMKPGSSNVADMYVTVSGGGGISANTQRVNINMPGVASRVNILNWRDRRIQ